jgi:hypothetical protein
MSCLPVLLRRRTQWVVWLGGIRCSQPGGAGVGSLVRRLEQSPVRWRFGSPRLTHRSNARSRRALRLRNHKVLTCVCGESTGESNQMQVPPRRGNSNTSPMAEGGVAHSGFPPLFPPFAGKPDVHNIGRSPLFRMHEGIAIWNSRMRGGRSIPPISLYCFTSSTRRFFALPSSVSFVATGAYGPLPNDFRRDAAMPCVFTSTCITASARF